MTARAPSITDRRIPELDGVRGVAIGLVLFWHYIICQLPKTGRLSSIIRHLGATTWSGVDLFFVLSGFLIGGILWDHHRSPRFLRTFYIRRTFRILPLYYAWLAIFIVLKMSGSGGNKWNFGDPLPLWSYALYVQNINMSIKETFGPSWLGMSWSLAVEEQFYLILPALFIAMRRRGLIGLLILLSAAAFMLRGGISHRFHTVRAQYVLLPCRWDALFLGVLGAYAVRQPPWVAWARARFGQLAGVWIVLLIGAIVLTLRQVQAHEGWKGSFELTWFAWLYIGLILLVVLFPEKSACAFFRLSWLRKLGGIAYGVYMFHVGIAGLIHHWGGNEEPQLANPRDGLLTLASLVATLALATISYRYFESPFIRLGKRACYDEASVPPVPSPAECSVPHEDRR